MSLSSALRRAVPVAAGAAAALVLLPDVLRLDGRLPLIAAVAWRPHAVAGAAAAGAVLSAWRPTRRPGVALGLVACAGAGAVAARLPRPARAGRAAVPLTVLTANVFSGRADTGRGTSARASMPRILWRSRATLRAGPATRTESTSRPP